MSVNSKLVWMSAVVAFTAVSAGADSMLVPAVELRDEGASRYVLKVQTTRALVSGIRRPVPPDRCAVGDAEREDGDRWVQLRYGIDCRGESLGPRDVVVLPWVVDGVQLTAKWLDGTSRRAIFGREPAGVVIRLARIMDYEATFVDLAKEHGGSGWKHLWTGWNHLLFILALTLLGRAAWTGLGGLVAGHAVSLIASEAGVIELLLAPAEAVIAGATVLLATGLVKNGSRPPGLFGMAVVLGILHGLGTASDLLQSGVASSRLVPALFMTNVGLDLGSAIMVAGALLAFKIGAPLFERRRTALAGFVGSAAVFVFIGVMRGALTTLPVARANASGFMEVNAPERDSRISASGFASRRQIDTSGKFASPFMSYLIVEPYQVRHEVLVDVSSTRSWIDIAVDASGQIPLESQTEVSEAVAALVSERVVLTIDGASGRAASTRAEFIELGPAGASTRPAPVPEPLESAILGVIVVYETSGIADSVEIDWNLFSDEISRIPFTIVDPAAVDEKEVSPEVPRVLWRNTLEDIEVPEIEAVAASSAKLPLLSMGLILLALIVARRHAIAVVCLFAAYIAYPFARTEASVAFAGAPRLDRVEASELIDSLLTNVYRAFDIHNEDLIYDRLALSVTGDQLRDVYLESRRALELENRGGASVRIDEVVVQEIRAIRETGDGGYEIDAVWTVGGSVNHFGHIHFRQNRYDAAIGIVPAGGTWKIRELELVEEKRLL